MAPPIIFPGSLAMAWLQQHYFCEISEDFKNFLKEQSYQNTLQYAPFTNILFKLDAFKPT